MITTAEEWATTAGVAAAGRWVGVGQSGDLRAGVAGREAARRALLGDQPSLGIAFCSPRHDPAELLGGIRAEVGDLPLIGCTTGGEITDRGSGDGEVVLAILGGPGFSAATAAATGISPRLRQAGAEVAVCAEAVAQRPHRALLMLSDGLAGDHHEMLAGAYARAGAGIPLVGGAAADGSRNAETWQLHGGQVLRNSVVAAAIGSDAPLGIGVRNSWHPRGEPMLVTASSGGRVMSLDGEPALDVYLDRLGAPAACRRDSAAFLRVAATHPLGSGGRSGQRLRCVHGVDLPGRSFTCNWRVAEGALVSFMECGVDSCVATAGEAIGDALRTLRGRTPLGLLLFDCVGRRGLLGEEGMAREVAVMAGACPGVPLAGFYTYGEIARVRGGSGFHSQSLVALAIG